MGGTVGDGQLLSVFLAVESFLLATVGLCLALTNPRAGFRNMPVSPVVLAGIAVSAQVGAALGAALAWVGLYAGGDGSFREWTMGIVLLALIVVEPVIAVLITLGLRFKP